MSMEPSDWFTPDELSDCCGAPVYNPGGNETGICKECKEHCEIEEEEEYTHKTSDGMKWRFDGGRPVSSLADEVMKEVEEDMKRIKEEEDLTGKEK